MSRQRGDAFESGASPGPLFEKPLRQLFGATDPHTSVAAAAELKASGRIGKHQDMALALVRAYPGRTCPELAAAAMEAWEGGIRMSLEMLRQRIGRRLNELTNPPGPDQVPGKPHLIERRGTRDGCALWWPVEGAR